MDSSELDANYVVSLLETEAIENVVRYLLPLYSPVHGEYERQIIEITIGFMFEELKTDSKSIKDIKDPAPDRVSIEVP